ncbi:MAG: transketolase [Firmicutes bacterium]|nr:transketolase [Bacillota bacterium]
MISLAKVKELEEKAKQVRLDIVNMAGTKKACHLGGSASCADIVTALYFHKMSHRPSEPDWPDRDRFLLSKGHASQALYATLAQAGYFPRQELGKFKEVGANLQGHPENDRVPGVEVCTGSLGQGLSVGLGMALGARMDKKSYCVYVLLGDGEMYEGQIWEAAIAASAYKLDNLVAVVDANGFACTGKICDLVDMGSIKEKLAAFGWFVTEVDGHDLKALADTLDGLAAVSGRPKAVIARTIKGKGFPFAENDGSYHHVFLTDELYQKAIQGLNSGGGR